MRRKSVNVERSSQRFKVGSVGQCWRQGVTRGRSMLPWTQRVYRAPARASNSTRSQAKPSHASKEKGLRQQSAATAIEAPSRSSLTVARCRVVRPLEAESSSSAMGKGTGRGTSSTARALAALSNKGRLQSESERRPSPPELVCESWLFGGRWRTRRSYLTSIPLDSTPLRVERARLGGEAAGPPRSTDGRRSSS